jgi:hypothetical protein
MKRPHAADVGVQPEFLAQAHVHRPKSTADRRGKGGFQGQLCTPDALECVSRQRIFELLDRRHPSLTYIPDKGRAQHIRNNLHGFDYFGPDTVARNQSRFHVAALMFARHAHRSFASTSYRRAVCDAAQWLPTRPQQIAEQRRITVAKRLLMILVRQQRLTPFHGPARTDR